ncbi:MAG: sugar ABC transporter permease [Bacteroidetes bacterium]|nr:sugar ABC transporter permease [Bacteroidota bacterium]
MTAKFSLSKIGNVRSLTLIAALACICIVFHFATDEVFLSARNFSNLMRQASVVGIVACGMVMIIVSREIDLSAGSAVALAGGLAAIANVQFQMHPAMAIGVALAAGLLIGAINGLLVAYTRIPAFIVTLGGLLVYRGLIKGFTQGETIGPVSEGFQMFGTGFVPSYIVYVVLAISIGYFLYNAFNNFKNKNMINAIKYIVFSLLAIAFIMMFLNYKGLPVPVLIVLIVALVVSFVMENVPFGRYIFAIGGNREAAFYSGINIRKQIFRVYILMGLLIAIAGIVYTAQLGSATSAAARNLELDVIAACVIGGCSLLGGRGNIFDALCGALIMASLDNGMSLLNVQDYIQDVIKGVILVLAVGIDMLNKKN